MRHITSHRSPIFTARSEDHSVRPDGTKPSRWWYSVAFLTFTAECAFGQITIDGVLDEAEWSRAHVFTDFRVISPYTLGAPTHPTEVRLLGTPEGIAISFRCAHPPTTPRHKEQTARDIDNSGDRVNVYIDLDADSQVAYNITYALAGSLQDATYTNENEYNSDWDGDIAYAVRETEDEWFVETLLPWTIAPRKNPDSSMRTVGVSFGRVIAARQERSMLQGLSYNLPRFVSDFPTVEIEQYQSSLVHVFPYATATSDRISGEYESKAGLDILWKPSGQFQLAATLNPDFGQVEADELVVNFDAIEVFLSDKRPFFAENQALFDVQLGDDDERILFTRRIGGESDFDDERAAEIDAAVKMQGSVGNLEYGWLAATEDQYDEEIGRGFAAQRLRYNTEDWALGYLGTWTDRPYYDREAVVHQTDIVWEPGDKLYAQANLLVSETEEEGEKSTGDGEVLELFFTPSADVQHEFAMTHFSRDLDFNDLGFQERASVRRAGYSMSRHVRDFADDDPRGAVLWELYTELRYNDEGDQLGNYLGLYRETQRDSGSMSYTWLDVTGEGFDDLISRGNGNARIEPRLGGFGHGYESPRLDKWSVSAEASVFQEGNEDYAVWSWLSAEYFARDNLTTSLEVGLTWSRDWLIWEYDNLLASYRRKEAYIESDLNWFPAPNHELRIKLQWLGIDAREPTPFRIADNGDLIESGDLVEPFRVSNLGLQVRYRWTFAPQSDLYVVYGRGGFLYDEGRPERGSDTEDLFALLTNALDLRDSDQFVVKLRYRFGSRTGTSYL